MNTSLLLCCNKNHHRKKGIEVLLTVTEQWHRIIRWHEKLFSLLYMVRPCRAFFVRSSIDVKGKVAQPMQPFRFNLAISYCNWRFKDYFYKGNGSNLWNNTYDIGISHISLPIEFYPEKRSLTSNGLLFFML